MERIKCYTIDLTKTKGSGEFECPTCGVEMSPDDETEDAYTILEAVTKKDRLERIILKCIKCGTRIQLTGFNFLNETIPQAKRSDHQSF